ncbi:hypothetical protein HFO56_23910 [Rhizobium laguerreae]|uniref:hypothetical protein n=1 Tax=Rhizobium laguerreae TaxID=1076926 RepID=UPI001C921092|nr:hypothetical protein [Rhizobium laguerreae]MBY3155374.1 hypothetical protein [Rhizobium laguerreae]
MELDYPRSEGLNFGGGKPKSPEPVNLSHAHALFRLLETRAALEAKIASVPDYTGQWDRKDYFADEQEDFNRAVDVFAETTKALNKD